MRSGQQPFGSMSIRRRRSRRACAWFALPFVSLALVCGGCSSVDVFPTGGSGSAGGDSGGGGGGIAPSSIDFDLPHVQIVANTEFCCSPRDVAFEANLYGGTRILSKRYVWSFGDGKTAEGQRVEHSYQADALYNVRVDVELQTGDAVVGERTLAVGTIAEPVGPMPPDEDGGGETAGEDEPVEGLLAIDAGELQYVASGDTVSLEATLETAGLPVVALLWRQVAGPFAALSPTNELNTSFVAPVVDRPTDLRFELIARDGALTLSDIVTINVDPDAPRGPPSKTYFAITLPGGEVKSFVHADPNASSTTRWVFLADELSATIEALPGDQFELTVNAAVPIQAVWFPWYENPVPATRVLVPRLMGLSYDNSTLDPWVWNDPDRHAYPGDIAAPGNVLDNVSAARGMFATNWPPRQVDVMHSRGRQTIRYDEPLSAGESGTYRVLIVDAEASEGKEAWQVPLDRYRDWLDERLFEERLWPIDYPDWLREANGWSNVQLQFYDDPAAEVRRRWNENSRDFPIIQAWGGMSDRHDEGDDPEFSGCCLIDTALHPRNASVPDVARDVVADGGFFGYYVRPQNRGPVAGPDPEAATNLQWVLDWIDRNFAEYGANTAYLDTFITHPIGPPLEIAQQFADGVYPRGAVAEYAVDIYPAAFLVSGGLHGRQFYTLPGGVPDRTNRTGVTTFPRFVRYLLGDRIIFLGESNGDLVLWGDKRGYNHYGERQAFLMGCKLDWMQHFKSGGADNPGVEEVVRAWNAIGFWDRDPVYLDTVGLTDVPPELDVRRFRGSSGETLLAIDNSSGLTRAEILVDGQPVTLLLKHWLEVLDIN